MIPDPNLKLSITSKHTNSPIGSIPADWNVGVLGDYAYIKARIGWRGLSSSEYTDEGPYLIAGKHIDGSKIKWDFCDHLSEHRYEESKEIQLQKCDIIISKDGTIGRLGFIDFLPGPATINGTMMLIRSDPNHLYPKFIYYYFQGSYFQRIIQEKVSGSSVPHIFQRDMVKLLIPLFPIIEQNKIAAILSSVDDTIQATQAVIEQIRRVKQGLLLQLLTRGIGHTRFKQTEIGEIPYGWEICDLAQVANVIDCKHRTPKYTDQGYPVIRPRDVKEGILEFSGCLRIPQDEYEDLIENHCPLSGDVVYSRNATFGIASIVDTDRPFAIGQDVCIITGIHMCGEILFYLLNSRVVRKQLDSLSAGSTFKRINLKDIRRFKVPLIPKAEQGEIVAIADSLSEYLRATNLELDQLIQTKRGLMQDLLTGRVRVNCAE